MTEQEQTIMTTETEKKLSSVWRQVGYSALVSVSAVAIGYFYLPIPIPALPTVGDRMLYTLRLLTLEVAMFLAGIVAIGGLRLHSGQFDPVQPKRNSKLDVHLRYLQNTGEQVLLSVFGKLVLSSYLGESNMKLIPILVLLFVIGRVTFWYGYAQDPFSRMFGFSMTNHFSVIPVYIALLYFVIGGILTTGHP